MLLDQISENKICERMQELWKNDSSYRSFDHGE